MATAKTKMIAAAAVGLLLVGGGAVAVTTMMSSPRQRRNVIVTSPAQPVVMASPVSAGAIKGAAIPFSEGTTVELIGISDAPTDNTRWWAADGTPITPPAKRPGGGLRGQPGQPSFQLLLRKVDGPDRAEMMVQLRGVTISGASSTEQNINGERLHSDMFTLRETTPPPIVDVAVSLAAGPWLPEQRFPLPPVTSVASAPSPTSRSLSTSAPAPAVSTTNPSSAPAIVINSVRDAGKGITEVDLSFAPEIQRDRRAFDQQFYLVDANGRQFFAQSWTGYAFGSNVVQFHAPRAQVVALVYRRRPYETREIRNVSLVPGQKTIVAISDVVPR
jgi:hypothetical protein